MQEIQRKDDRTTTRVELINPYAHGLTLVDLEVPQSTSADGWKYHKRNKRKKNKLEGLSMKISELIKNLNEIKDGCGDLEVEVFSNPYENSKYVALNEELFTVDKENNTLLLG